VIAADPWRPESDSWHPGSNGTRFRFVANRLVDADNDDNVVVGVINGKVHVEPEPLRESPPEWWEIRMDKGWAKTGFLFPVPSRPTSRPLGWPNYENRMRDIRRMQQFQLLALEGIEDPKPEKNKRQAKASNE